MPKTVKRRKNKLAGRYRNRWPDEAEISGRMIPKWVADSCRNRWPDHPEICSIPHLVPPIISGDPGLYSERTSTCEPAQFGVCYHGADWRGVAITCDALGENAFRCSARDRNWSCLHGGQLCDDALFSGHTSDGGNASSGAVFLRLDSLLSAFFCSVTLLCR